MTSIAALLAACLAFGQEAKTLKGSVEETIEAGQYTYVRLAAGGGERWAAVPKAALKKGAVIEVQVQMTMEKFESPSLHRTFDSIAFGTVGPAAVPAKKELPRKAVSRAEGADARTVSEVYARMKDLKGRPVAVRGRVVKYNAGILGSNWLHLQDGSGSAKAKDNDLAVTTKEQAAVGDVVTVKGAVTLDKDLGAGYFFPVLIEDARIVRP